MIARFQIRAPARQHSDLLYIQRDFDMFKSGIEIVQVRITVLCFCPWKFPGNCYHSTMFTLNRSWSHSCINLENNFHKIGIVLDSEETREDKGFPNEIGNSRLTTCAGSWLRTVTSDQTVYNNSSLPFWTRRYDITGNWNYWEVMNLLFVSSVHLVILECI